MVLRGMLPLRLNAECFVVCEVKDTTIKMMKRCAKRNVSLILYMRELLCFIIEIN